MTQWDTNNEVHGAGGALLARYTGDSNSRSFVPFNGDLLAEYYCGGMIFDHPDEIGSATTATDCTGNNLQERLFYPFGESWTGAGSLGMHQEFAKLADYDPETDQYNTPNRHYTPMGRWMSPVPSGVKAARLDDPQTWNMYAYARNNPTTVTDPSGLMPGGPQTVAGFDSANGMQPYATMDGISWTPPDGQTNGGSNNTTPQETQAEQAQNTSQQQTQQNQLPDRKVLNQVNKEFPGIGFTEVPGSAHAHNGHENITVTGTATKEQLEQIQKTLAKNKGFPPGSRIDIKIDGKSFSLHVEFPKVTGSGDTRNLQFQTHIDRGNPNRDAVGLGTHVLVDGFRGAVFHHNDPGLDPQ